MTTWNELPIIEDENMVVAFCEKYTKIGCPYHEFKKLCPEPVECAIRGRCHQIHVERHQDNEIEPILT